MSSTDLAFYVQLPVKSQCVEEWKGLLAEVIDEMSKEDTFVSCTLHQSLEKENLFILYERWSEPSVDAFVSNQMTKEYRKVYEDRLAELLESPRNASIALCLQTWDSNQ